MNEVVIDNEKLSLPSCWNDLSYRQLLQVCRLFNLGIHATHFKWSLVIKFLGINARTLRKIDPEDAYFLCQTLNFLLEDVTLTKAVVQTIHCPGFPWTRYYGPSDVMGESTFGEFTQAQVRYEEYNRTLDPVKLDEMVAILFRPKKSFWWIRKYFIESSDPRKRFIDRTLSARVKSFSKVDREIKKAVFIYFSGVQKLLPELFPNVYKKKPDSSADSLSGWSSLIISLADGKTDDQSLDRVMNSNLYNVFLGLEQKSIDYFNYLKKYQND